MSFTKIQDADLTGIGVIGLPDTPGLSTAAMQNKFEETARSVIIPKHNDLIDELEDSPSAGSLGANPVTGRTSAPNIQAVMEKLSTDLKVVEDGMATAIADAHTHDNKAVIDELGDNGSNKLTYLGSVVGETNYNNLSNQPQINGHTLTGNQSNADLDIPTKLSDLTDDATHRVVTDTEKASWNDKSKVEFTRIKNSGEKIATIKIDGTSTDIYASSGGGGGGGGAVDSVNGQTGVVHLALKDIEMLQASNPSVNDGLKFDGTNWVNIPLPPSALSGSYADLSGKPSIPDSLSDLTTDVSISGTPSQGQALIVNSSGKWENQALPSGGHTMVDNTPEADMIDEIANATSSNDKVVSAYGIQKWTNCEAKNILVSINQGTSQVGVWNDNWKSESPAVRTGWIWHKELYRVLKDANNNDVTDIKIDPIFLAADDEVVNLYGVRIDDDYTYNGEHGGCVAFKLNGKIRSASGAKVGVQLTHLRTEDFVGTIIT